MAADNFLVAGFHELQRSLTRLTLRRKVRQRGKEREVALAAVGQRAWEEHVDLSPFADVRDRLAALAARADEISQTTGRLEASKTALEQERQSRLDAFGSRRREVQEKRNPVDTALRDVRAKRIVAERAIAQGASQQPKTPDVEANTAAARTELPALTGEETKLTAEAQQYADQIAAIDAEQKTDIGRIDGELTRVRSELRETSQQAAATQKERGEAFLNLGSRIYEGGAIVPALSEAAARVAAIDRERAGAESDVSASLALSASLPPGTMVTFWGVVVGVPIVLVAIGLGVSLYVNRDTTAPAVETAAATPVEQPRAGRARRPKRVDPERVRAQTVERFTRAGDASEKALHDDAVRILTQDIEVMGASGAPEYLPILMKVLQSREPALRQAAADSIGMIGATAAEKPELTRLLTDPVPGVAAAARRALAQPATAQASESRQ